MCQGWPFAIPDIIAATEPDAILRTDLYDRPPLPAEQWTRGRVVLLGDAAHPMVSTLGQGAATALEDAVVLARRLGDAPDIAAGLRAYALARTERTGRIVRTAHTLARLATWTSPVAVMLRNAALRLTPAWVTARTAEEQLGYDAASA